MGLFVVLLLVLLFGFFLATFGRLTTHDPDLKAMFSFGGSLLAGLGFVFLLVMSFTQVDDGNVGVTKSFGKYGESTLSPGISFKWPWEEVTQIDTKLQAATFSDDVDEAVSGPISAQASGGGNLRIELTVQYEVDTATADDLLREVGSDWFNRVVLPPIRSCSRDATTSLTLEEAYSTRRADIATNAIDCLSPKLDEYGISLVDVLIRDVDPGQEVRNAIDAKQQAEQDVQRAEIRVREAEANAREEAARALGVSNAEQIIACGGIEREDGTVVPNDSCEDQFSDEYLQWLYINQLSEVEGVVILPPNFDGELFIQTPQISPAPTE